MKHEGRKSEAADYLFAFWSERRVEKWERKRERDGEGRRRIETRMGMETPRRIHGSVCVSGDNDGIIQDDN